MASSASALQLLRQQLQRLPGVGERAAGRWAQWLLLHGKGRELAEALQQALQCTDCQRCQRLTAGPECSHCSEVADPTRVAVVIDEDQADRLLGAGFPGFCFITHGRLSPTAGIGPESLGLDRLKALNYQRIDAFFAQEVEDRAMLMYLRQLFRGQAEVHHMIEEDGWRS